LGKSFKSQREPYYQYKQYLIDRYGDALFRVPIDIDMGCPHRNTDGLGGCTFCPEDGSKAVQTAGLNSLQEQLDKAVSFAEERYRAKEFMAYLQAYTATFAPVSVFRKHVIELLNSHSFKALSIGTRPDCLPNSTLDYLEELNNKLDVWVELGIQTTHDKTLIHIQREHDWASSEKAIYKLKKRNLLVVAHVILGLPGEDKEMMMQTAEKLASLPIDGVKIHNLHVIKGTQLADEYEQSPFKILSEEEYIELAIEFLRRLPKDCPVLRITTDTLPEELIAPKWKLKKGQIISNLIKQMESKGVLQGDLYQIKDEVLA
jgi:uncharacterized protein